MQVFLAMSDLIAVLQKGPVIKLIHIKSQTSVALPVYTSDLGHLSVLESKQAQTPKDKVSTS